LKNKHPAIMDRIIVLIRIQLRGSIRGSEIIQEGENGNVNI
jgi:hypothetical protein